MVLPQEDTVYTVPRPLQKLGGDSKTPCVHTHPWCDGHSINISAYEVWGEGSVFKSPGESFTHIFT